MFKRITVFVLVAVFLAAGTVVMAEGRSSCQDKGIFQSMYDWCAGCDKVCDKAPAKTGETSCKACGKKCCQTCQTDCGGKCCAKCCYKK
jgi:hypothetical protein